METIVLDKVKHKGKQVLLLKFPYNQQLINLTKKLPEATWSNTYKSWYTVYNMDVLHQIKQLFTNDAIIDASELKKKTEQEKNAPPDIREYVLSEDAKMAIEKFKSWMRSRRYSDSTIGAYTEALKTFLKFYSSKAISAITNDDVIEFNNKYILANDFSSSFQNQVVNAIKLFFLKVENTNMDIASVHRPKREKVLPNVLSKEEIKSILDAPSNIKHKAMLSLIYSCGLRCGETLRIKPEHIDSKRKLLIIKNGKGKKDRIIPLSQKIILLLREYYNAHKPKVYLFEGQIPNTMYDERSLQQVLKRSLEKTRITKPVTLHWLRHSYATHLLENGTDLRYIQEILGHSRSTTTEIYTHVSNKSIQKIISPFDYL